MDLQLKDKIVIVTGGAKGIGKAISKRLSAEGAIVVIAGRNAIDNAKLVKTIETSGGEACSIEVELSKKENCKKLIEKTVRKFGKIDGLINNAGTNDGIGLESGTPEKFVESLQNNLLHYYCLVHFALPYLKKSKGAIVNIGSKVSITGQGNTSGYAASKGGINALTREWALELLPYSIRVNCVLPAEVWTPSYKNWINSWPNSKKKLESIVSKIPLENRFTTSEEISDTAVFLLSPRSSHTTGEILFVDGGYVHLDRAIPPKYPIPKEK